MHEGTDGRQSVSSGHLNGWKEIAAFLNKSVRTVQRWEARFGLPVHRIHTDNRGEIVYANPEEIREWLARKDTALSLEKDNGQDNGFAAGNVPEMPAEATKQGEVTLKNPERAWGRRSYAIGGVAAMVFVLIGALLVWRSLRPGPPAAWTIVDSQLEVRDARGTLLWSRAIEPRFSPPFDWLHTAAIVDLDGDGPPEVVFARTIEGLVGRRLYCFEANGTTRFEHEAPASTVFGDRTIAGPFLAAKMLVTKDASKGSSIWLVSEHYSKSATVVERIDARGKATSQYWNDGHLYAIAEGTLGGRKVVALGGVNDEYKRPTIILLDANAPSGSTPSSTQEHRCVGCAGSAPLAVFLLPVPELGRLSAIGAEVNELTLVASGSALHAVLNAKGQTPWFSGPVAWSLSYEIRGDGSIDSPQAADDYRRIHDQLWREGKLDHSYGERDEAELREILTWKASAYVPLERRVR